MQSEAFYNPDFDTIYKKLTPVFLRDVDVLINSVNGDFDYGFTDSQDVDFILIAKRGQFFWEPLIGYDAQRLQNAKVDLVQENSTLIAELGKDGFNNVTDLLIGHTSDSEFVNSIRPEERATLPKDSLVINVNAERI